MLARILRTHLRPSLPLIVGVIAFQLAQALASLVLPALNADIIDRGIARGDTGYILGVGGVMLAVTLVQIACAIAAVYFGARVAMADVDERPRVGGVEEEVAHEVGALRVRGTEPFHQIADEPGHAVREALRDHGEVLRGAHHERGHDPHRLLHREALPTNRATVLSMNSMVAGGTYSLGLLVLGPLAEHTSTALAMVVCGAFSIIGAVLYLPAIRHERASRAADEPEPAVA